MLIGPVGGRWNPRYDFEQVLARHVPGIPDDALPAAFAAGQVVLDTASGTADRTGYHRAILRALGVVAPTSELLAELEQPTAGLPVETYPRFGTFWPGCTPTGCRWPSSLIRGRIWMTFSGGSGCGTTS
ncbi:hypothetical protein Aau02nite_39450 [Amorphoplanes auranticolor]|uniref:Uncharacterized protein n=1 Tax=Actinoplanes auranticolor TaxID=47988 RepID=A0A919SE05_9ACTN|nr:hypothetical protein Aau02nite_39450 [Actinoplanes auranticolor]